MSYIHVTHICLTYVSYRCVAVCCSVLQCVAVCCSVLQCVARVAVCVAVGCSLSQCVAVCCSGPYPTKRRRKRKHDVQQMTFGQSKNLKPIH